VKRFYKIVSAQQEQGGYSILLDQRPVKTKSGKTLLARNAAIAQEVVLEWAGQTEHILPDTMPIMQILSTKIDRVAQERAAMTRYVLKYLDTDLLCYPAELPPEVAAEQGRIWTPWRAWFESQSGATLQTTTGLAAISQEPAALAFLIGAIEKLDDDRFTILQIVTALSGSVILALAFVSGVANAQDVYACCYIEEEAKDRLYDAKKYGNDPMLEKQQNAARRDLAAAQMYLELL
jgi:chaperone required for assembly of F1-ATPase